MSKRITKRSTPQHEKFHKLLLEKPEVRKKLYTKFGRVRCYMYKTARTVPNETTAKIIERISGLSAAGWPR